MPLAEGRIFAGYTIVRSLGSGGMGEVYLARHPRLPRRDALKLLRSDLSADLDYRARFEREADLASTLWHPHIVGVHDRGQIDNQLWISMDYVDGWNAAEFMGARYPGGMPVGTVLDIVTAVAGALDYAHKQGLLHRDVKPSNIMVAHTDNDGDNRILLADFGIARNVDDISGLTSTNMAIGTVAYSAPEQLMGEDIDGRADQYALAATAYHMLTGEPLFPNSNPAVVISRHLNADPPRVADRRPELASLDAALAVALAKNPAERYGRCGDFARALAASATSIEWLNDAPTGSAPRRTRAQWSRRELNAPVSAVGVSRSRRTTLAAAVGMVAAVVIAALALWRPWAPSDSGPATATTITSMAPVSTTTGVNTASSTVAGPLPAPVFAAAGIDSVLLSPDEITALTGGEFTGDPAYQEGPVELISSAQGTTDNTHAIDPPTCAGVIFGAEQQVYGDTGYQALRDQLLGKTVSDIDDLVEQTVVVFPTAQQAHAVLSSSTIQWQECASGHPLEYPSDASISHDAGYERGWSWTLTDVAVGVDRITTRMTAVSNLNGNAPACQMALGVRVNVVVKTKTCWDTGTNPYEPDPALAGDFADRLAAAMLDRVVL